MGKKLGVIKIPKILEEIIEERSKSEKDENIKKPSDWSTEKYNNESFLSNFKRRIDPVLISLFFGLYKSRELPPIKKGAELPELEGRYEFGTVGIEKIRKLFVNLLLCLWIKEKGYPKKGKKTRFRKSLYNFLEKVLDYDFFREKIIPFYTSKSLESDTGRPFLNKLKSSHFTGYKQENLGLDTPEFLFKEFKNEQENFIKDVIKPLIS